MERGGKTEQKNIFNVPRNSKEGNRNMLGTSFKDSLVYYLHRAHGYKCKPFSLLLGTEDY